MRIGSVELANNLILAPMAGVSDLPFRLLCREMGAGLAVMEMVSAKAILYRNKNTKELMRTTPEDRPVSLQLFGSDPEIVSQIALQIEEEPFDILDFNMGCPVPKVVKNGEGSALMQEPEKAARIVRECVRRIHKPMTVKIRKGFNDKEVNAVEVAKRLEDAGAAAIAVHGRTREQYYSGKADWSVIASVKRAVSRIPVIGNGDVMSRADGIRMMEETGCDLVMIGRGALGNPWIFDKDHEGRPSPEELKAVMLRHLTDTAELKGDHIAVLEMRKHVGWYLKGRPGAAAFRDQVNRIDDLEELKNAIDGIL